MRQRRKRLSQPRLQGQCRHAMLSCLHPEIAGTVEEHAKQQGVSVGWIINDALAVYYGQRDLRSSVLYQQRHRLER